MTYEELESKVDFFDFSFLIANERFEPSNMEDPVQTVLNDQYRVSFSVDRQTEYEIHVQKSTYEIDSGNLFSQKKTGEFYKVSRDK